MVNEIQSHSFSILKSQIFRSKCLTSRETRNPLNPSIRCTLYGFIVSVQRIEGFDGFFVQYSGLTDLTDFLFSTAD